MVNVKFTGTYYLGLQQLLVTQPQLKHKIEKAVVSFKRNPVDSRSMNHALRRKLEGKWAFCVTDDIRIVYEWLGKNTARFLTIGGHKNVYKKIATKKLSL